MREARFIKNNLERWNQYQEDPDPSPDEMANRFITLLDDLSYAKTFYPGSKVTRWINGMAASIYQNIYKNGNQHLSKAVLFWKFELPLIFRRYQKFLLFTFFLFLAIVSVAVLSCVEDPQYARDFFDNKIQRGYYNQTIRNIQEGDPFNVYRDRNPFSMFVRIAYNNISVAFKTVIAGVFFGIGTLYILWTNGLMLGCFQYIFYSQGLGWESVWVIWIHGTIEISSIVIAGCAGFILGTGWLFPGTFSRKESFLRSARDAMKVCISLIPFFIVASFFESYITQLMSNTFQTNAARVGLPVFASVLILAGSFLLIVWYFIWYPRTLQKRGFQMTNGVLMRNGVKYEK